MNSAVQERRAYIRALKIYLLKGLIVNNKCHINIKKIQIIAVRVLIANETLELLS